jgi:rhodanese-related sulfurtransferase
MPTYKTGADLIAEAKSRVTELSPQDAVAQRTPNVVFLDVREPSEWNMGHVPGAVHIPRGQLEVKVEGIIDRSKHIVVYCAAGGRSALATDTLRQMGYDHVTSLRDGFRGWADAGGAIED